MVTVHFDAMGKLVGSHTRSYLLEKTRVSAPPATERSFHIFYRMLAGMEAAQLAQRHLQGVTEYELLSVSGCATVEGVDGR